MGAKVNTFRILARSLNSSEHLILLNKSDDCNQPERKRTRLSEPDNLTHLLKSSMEQRDARTKNF